MKIVVIGLGQIGQEISRELAQKNHEVTVIDIDKELVENFTNKYDLNGIVGSGTSKKIQEKANCDIADLVISVTSTDETNLMSCLTAKYLGARYTIAKVQSLEFENNDEFLRQKFNIDFVINSELSTASEIIRLLSNQSSIKTEHFIESKINLAEITIREDSMIIGETTSNIEKHYKNKIKIGCITRDNKVIIPNIETKIQNGDIIYILANTLDLHQFLKKNKLIEKPVKSVLIVGSGNIGEKVIEVLLKMGIKVKVLEFDLKKCQELSEKYEEAEVVFGEQINSDLLIEEGIKKYDCCISLTKNDESNLVVSMFAWSCKTRKIITKITSMAYTSMLHNVKIDTTVSPYSVILSMIIKYVRSINNSVNESIRELYRIANNQVEAIEFYIDNDYDFCNKNISSLKIKQGVLLALIIRRNKVIAISDDIELKKNDKVIIISKVKNEISRLEDIWQ